MGFRRGLGISVVGFRVRGLGFRRNSSFNSCSQELLRE